jgi:hypothetical protein
MIRTTSRAVLALTTLLLLSSLPLARPAAAQTPGVQGAVPAGLPNRLSVGLFETAGSTWMRDSGAPWDVRYRYFTKGWADNWGWGARDGAFATAFFNETAAQGSVPTVTLYQLFDEPGGGEAQYLAKTQTAATMRSYFSDVKLLMQRAKDFGRPVVLHVEPDLTGFLQQQSANNPNAYAAVADSGLPELAGLPNTVAGWSLAFLQLRKAVGATNVVLGIHVSAWASGLDLSHSSASAPLEPEVQKVLAFLRPAGLAANVTGATYDVLVGDPLDRDADYYRLVRGEDRWWDPSDTAPVNTKSFNRYAEWMRLWNQASGKRWVLWQLPLGNSNHLNTHNNGGAREGYKDNRPEYFFGPQGDAHRRRFANAGAVALLFGLGATGQSSFENDIYTDGQPFMRSRAGAFLRAGGLALPAPGTTLPPAGGGTPTPPPTPAPAFTSAATAAPASVTAGGSTTLTTTLTNTGGALSGGQLAVDVLDAAGARVGGQTWTGLTLAAGASAPYAFTWTAPSTPGTYRVRATVTAAGGSPGYHQNASAGSLTVTAPAPADGAQYHFEAGAQGWAVSGAQLGAAGSSADRAAAGARALKVPFTGTSGTGSVAVGNASVPAGRAVTFRVWVPAGSGITSVQPYVQEGAASGWRWTGTWRAIGSLQAGAWNTLTVTVPAGAASPLFQLGVQFATRGGWSGAAYVDAVRW